MTTIETTPVPHETDQPRGLRKLSVPQRWMVYAAIGMVIMSIVRTLSGEPGLTASGTVGAALRLAVPIMMAGLAGIFSERVGIVNIGLEGMMVLGTWFGAYGAWEWGPWRGLAFGALGGAIGALVHAIATVTFNVDHIISGVAINIAGPGVARYLSVITYEPGSGGSATQSPPRKSEIGKLTIGPLSDWLGDLQGKRWFLVSDVAGVLRGITTDVSWATIVAFLLVVASFYVLWRTSFGLRLRSIGENPYAAESLGVPVYRIKYIGVIISGALAGFGGAFLAIVQASIYREGQVAGRGFIGLATMIFGNWRPGGLMGGSLLFGYSQGLQLRASDAVPALLLLAAILCAIVMVRDVQKRHMRTASLVGIIGVLFLVGYLTIDKLSDSIVYCTPYVVTLVVLATSSQRLRPPAAAGNPYRRGEAH